MKMPRVDFSAFGMSIFLGNPMKCMKILECPDFEVNNVAMDIWRGLSFLKR